MAKPKPTSAFLAASATAVDFSALPEGCIAHILSFTSPQDVCRSASVSSTFRSAADSDALWDRFLPPDYADEISHAVSQLFPPFSSKKQLYLHLCSFPVLIHGGAKSFSLDKKTGKKCYMISPRQLFIVWGDVPRYWRWSSPPEARFAEVAELVSVCWLEIRGTIETEMLSPGTLYAAYLVFKPTTSSYGFQQQPVEVAVGLVGSETPKQTVYLDDDVDRDWRQRHPIVHRGFGLFNLGRRRIIGTQVAMSTEITRNDAPAVDCGRHIPKEREDRWLEVQLGEFFHDGVNGELEISVSEVKGGHWKGGLLIQGIELRPKALKT